MLLWISNVGWAAGWVGTLTNTASKRGSAIQFDQVYFMTYPMPDGTIDQGDRQHVSFKYSSDLMVGGATSTGALLNMMGRGLGWGLGSGMG